MSRRRRLAGGRHIHGVLLLDKPLGLSSNRALQAVKRLYKAAKAGHTGSLDPLATGMLPICLGEATKLSAHLLSAAKHYEVTAALGTQTATGDTEGEVVRSASVPRFGRPELQAVLNQFHGEIEQIPPMYSALKHQGKRLYELARQGEEVERTARTVVIHRIDVLSQDERGFRLRVSCSKGTYIRSLVEDIAAALSTCGHVAQLRRIGVDPFCDDEMVTLQTLEQLREQAGLAALDVLLRPVDQVLSHWPAVALDTQQSKRIVQGQAVSWQAREKEGAMVRLYRGSGEFLGLGVYDGQQLLPKRLLHLAH